MGPSDIERANKTGKHKTRLVLLLMIMMEAASWHIIRVITVCQSIRSKVFSLLRVNQALSRNIVEWNK